MHPCSPTAPPLLPPQLRPPSSERTERAPGQARVGKGVGSRAGARSPPEETLERYRCPSTQNFSAVVKTRFSSQPPPPSPFPASQGVYPHISFTSGPNGPIPEACRGLGAILEAFCSSSPAAPPASGPVQAKFAPPTFWRRFPSGEASRGGEGGGTLSNAVKNELLVAKGWLSP